MDSGISVRRSKRAKGGEDRVANGIDWRGKLPDGTLQRVLSLLPIKDAVRMSSLSKRLEDLWLSIPVLRLRQTDFPKRSIFKNFVERALLLRGSSPFEEFSLSCDVKSDATRIKSWIASVVRHGVQEICLQLEYVQGEGFVFRCQTLVKLRLKSYGTVPCSICLPSLKDLALERIEFVDPGSVPNLVFACPALESLSLKSCRWMGRKDITISAPNLRTLFIEDCNCCHCNLVIDGPNVISLSYEKALMDRSPLLDSSSLNEAALCFHIPYFLKPDKFSNVMSDLYKVRSLTLSGPLCQVDRGEGAFEALPIFCNMTELKLGRGRVFLGSKQLGILLRKCPNLKILEIAEGFDGDISQALGPAPPCFHSQLKKIVVRSFSPRKENLDGVALLLRKAIVLKEMVLYYDGTVEDFCKAAGLKKLPRGPKNCKVSLIL